MSSKKRKSRLRPALRKEIISYLKENSDIAFNYKQVIGFLGVKGSERRKLVNDILKELASDGILKQVERGVFIWNEKESIGSVIGTLEVTQRGAGYVIVEGLEKDIFIQKNHMARAFNGDRVSVRILKQKKNRIEGQIIDIIERNKTHFVGILEVSEKFAFVIPDDPKMDVDLFIPLEKIGKARQGYKVVAKLTDWPENSKSPFGEVTEILGKPGSNDAEMYSILAEQGISWSFPDEVIAESEQLTDVVSEEDLHERRDFRETLTFTIDPFDAKDFDDALSLQFLENGNAEVGIHIADVSHFVNPGTALDKEAKKRGNSVYLVDRVIPMLPERISNILCSLRPHEDKFTFSAIFEIDPQGKIQHEWFGKGIIHSDHRFTYEEAQELIEGADGPFKNEVLFLDKLAKKYRKQRLKNGALNITSEEVRFKLNDEGEPVEVVKKIAKDSNQLIEEFMLLANKRVAEYIGVKKKEFKIPFVYRVHDNPDMEKLATFNLFLSKFDLHANFTDAASVAKELNKLFDKTREENEFNVIQSMAIRSMAKAAYDISNIGHYGLGFSHYTHFTSPIRRYADLLVHRILMEELAHKKHKYGSDLRETCKHISRTERMAIEAERNSTKYFQVIFVRDDIGKEFDGIITGITEWGMYVEMSSNKCEGMVALKEMNGDTYVFDAETYKVKGLNYGDEYTVGDNVKVLLRKVNIKKRQIDLTLIS